MSVFSNTVAWFRVERHRAYLYRVLMAAGAAAGTYGLLSEQEIVVVLALAGAVLGNGLASANTTTKKEQQ